MSNALQATQINQHINEGVLVGNGVLVAETWSLNTQFDSLLVDALGSGTLFIDVLIEWMVVVNLVTQSCARTGRDTMGASAFRPVLVLNRTACIFLPQERTNVVPTLMVNQ